MQQAEPYRLTLFSKSRTHLPVMAADFLPREKQLFVVVADDECNIHALEFNPDSESLHSHAQILTSSSLSRVFYGQPAGKAGASSTGLTRGQTPNPKTATASSANQPSTRGTSPCP